MRQSSIAALVAGALVVAFTACGTRQETGTLVGAGAGAAAGAAITDGAVGGLVGAVVGGVLGREVAKAIDNEERERIAYALERNPTGEPLAWTDPDEGYRYRVTPTDTFYREYRGQSTPCREFAIDIYVDGRWEEGRGVACRGPEGNWQIQG